MPISTNFVVSVVPVVVWVFSLYGYLSPIIMRASLPLKVAMDGEAKRCAFWSWIRASRVTVPDKPLKVRVVILNWPPDKVDEGPVPSWLSRPVLTSSGTTRAGRL